MEKYKPTLNEAIDACRPDSDDLSLPEMHELAEMIGDDADVRGSYAQSQQFDTMVGRTMVEGHVPAGLAERLLASVLEVEAGDEEKSTDDSSNETSEPVTLRTSNDSAGTRRRWMPISIAGLVCITVMAVAATVVFRPTGPTREKILDETARWLNEAMEQPWNEDLQKAPSHHSPDSQITTPRGWQQLATQFDGQGVVYDLRRNIGEEPACLVVLAAECATSLPSIPTAEPTSTTAGRCVGVWQRENRVYVLIVQGRKQRYQRFIKTQIIASIIHSLPHFPDAQILF